MHGNSRPARVASRRDRSVGAEAMLYAFVGIFNTLLTLAIMSSLAWAGFHYSIYTMAGYLVGFVSSYLLNNRFTFGRKRYSFARFMLFVLISGALLIAVQLAQFVLIEKLLAPEIVGVGVGMVIYTGVGFVLNRRFVFVG